MGFRLLSKSVTLNDIEQHIDCLPMRALSAVAGFLVTSYLAI